MRRTLELCDNQKRDTRGMIDDDKHTKFNQCSENQKNLIQGIDEFVHSFRGGGQNETNGTINTRWCNSQGLEDAPGGYCVNKNTAYPWLDYFVSPQRTMYKERDMLRR